MHGLASKLKLLSDSERKKVEALVDSLINEHPVADRKVWKESILNVSVWTDEDVKQIEGVPHDFGKIAIEEW